MIQGTQSNAGKSLLAAAFCRIFTEDGRRTAPFKSQNMALNAAVTKEGGEIGRAQKMQAEACGIDAHTDMNPVLIKPEGDMRAQVIVNGRAAGGFGASAYRSEFYAEALEAISSAYGRLEQTVDRIVIEGAGSPAEINLKDRELVNMRIAEMADAPVILTADIDRGGVFAMIVGTLELLEPHERDRIAGFIINKFRGDVSLLQPGLDWLEAYTGKPVLGVVPYIEDLVVEEEDSLGLESYGRNVEGGLDIVVPAFPRMANYSDLDPLRWEEDVSLRLVERPGQLGTPDLIVLPGSKATLQDLSYLKQRGLDRCIQDAAEKGIPVIGICGGFQMLGERIEDPDGIEPEALDHDGLGLFPSLKTTMTNEKVVTETTDSVSWDGEVYPVSGYEIHAGRSVHTEASWGNGAALGTVYGTYMHDIFHEDRFRHALLDSLRKKRELPPVTRGKFREKKEASFQKLADTVRASVDMEKIEELIENGKKGRDE
ncbi:cobyric acid synthase [Alkalicoccus urumqiensis]|uniref:Cobyric acid synthase n=1 Tax=Alkalicoccus urumqiensis TaxID=1548213 RepID=A0A2P6MIL2_ALKUR|nr:cobyric acid synthase [Alkalicoccus urumqiensis]PRO66107.1 cobyric acid synthase CobQ [Alkalicoccus urumqiensis]